MDKTYSEFRDEFRAAWIKWVSHGSVWERGVPKNYSLLVKLCDLAEAYPEWEEIALEEVCEELRKNGNKINLLN